MSANVKPLVATIYNPQNQSKEALIAGFIARKQKFERLFRDVRDAPMTKPEQHYLIQGVRGMGKTTFLLRIAYEIENTPDLRQRLIPIVFNEEEYGISSLADVWERAAQYVEEADSSFAGLLNSITTQYGQPDYEQRVLQTLVDALRQHDKKLLLLIDNIGDLLKKLGKQEEQRLREVLLTTPELRLIGATSVVIEQAHDYNRPFYEFFKVIHLEGLSRQEATDLFQKLGETYHADIIQKIIEQQPGRIEAIRRLTGGVIRTMVLLFEILVENNTGSVFRDLNVLLDRVTPLYKHRMDDLPAQQQKIVAALATAWDAASAKELAQVVRLESKVVSAQLKQLIDNSVVEKIETNTKNHLYRLEERFFNIWYLMRFGRKTDQRVLWLVRFFEEIFGGNEEWMQERIDGHLQAMKEGTLDPETALFMTEAFRSLLRNKDFDRYTLLFTTKVYLNNKSPQTLSKFNSEELEDRKVWIDYLKTVSSATDENNYQKGLHILSKLKNPSGHAFYSKGICLLRLGDYKQAENMFTKGMQMNYGDATYWLGRLYFEIFKEPKKATFYFKKAIQQGEKASYIQLGLMKAESKRYIEAFRMFDKALEEGEFWAGAEAMNLAVKLKYIAKAIDYNRFLKFHQVYGSIIRIDNYINAQQTLTKLFYNLLFSKNLTEAGAFAKKLIGNYADENDDLVYLIDNIFYIWFDKFESVKPQSFKFLNEVRVRFNEQIESTKPPLLTTDFDNDALWLNYLVNIYIKLLLAKKQYHTAYNYFQQEEWQLKDRFKPLYYATLHFLRDEYPTEYLRMGPELKETVDDVLAEIEQMAIDYA